MRVLKGLPGKGCTLPCSFEKPSTLNPCIVLGRRQSHNGPCVVCVNESAACATGVLFGLNFYTQLNTEA